ncbi:MAG: YceI family protein [Chitinophagales bacterium]
MKKIIIISLTMLLASGLTVHAQTNYVFSPNHEFEIKGTSNVHDWEESVEKINGNGSFVINPNGSISILSVVFKVECKDIKSTHGSIMDSKTYDALKAEKNPLITYKLLSQLNNVMPSTTGTTVIAKGQLTIAGVTKPIDLQVKVSVKADGSISFEGTKTIKMTDFDISPPTAFMGAMKVGDEVVLNFKTVMQKN